ncbi:hypothetical protein [Bacillus sp. 1P06AnD]
MVEERAIIMMNIAPMKNLYVQVKRKAKGIDAPIISIAYLVDICNMLL